MTTPAIVLGNGLTAMTTARSLGRCGIPVYAIGPTEKDITRYSRHAMVVEQPAQITPESVVTGIRDTAKRTGSRPVVFCASDEYLEILSTHRELVRNDCITMLPSPLAVDTVLDKTKFASFCRHHDLLAPRTWSPETSEQFEECRDEAVFPVVIKPNFAHGSDLQKFQRNETFAKILLVGNRRELDDRYRELRGIGANVLVQEYIPGPDHEHYSYYSYRNASSTELCGVGVRKIRLTPIHGGAGTFIEIENNPELAETSRNLLDKLQYTGIVSVCCKRDARTGKFVLHEVNGRIPMGHGSSVLVGIDLPYIAYQDTIGEPIDISSRPPRQAQVAGA